MNYFDEIHVRLEKYKNVHKKHPRMAVMKMLIWNSLFLVKPPVERNQGNVPVKTVDIIVKKKEFNVGFLVNGGIGDFVILANYIYKFRQKFECPRMHVDIFFSRNDEAAYGIYSEELADRRILIDHDELYNNNIHRKYDLFIDVDRYPLFTNRNIEKINRFQPLLLDYMQTKEKFQWRNPRVFQERPQFDGQSAMLCIINGIKRINQVDIDGILGMTEEYEYEIPVDKNYKEYLNRIGVAEGRYIVIVSGADPKCGGMENNKIWPDIYYDRLTESLKQKYPEYTLVQMGISDAAYEFKKIDLNLMGKTSFEETKILLKYARLLIGNEGGMVHLRYALHGGTSVVLFGSTDEKFFGYSSNINLRGEGCAHPCEWLYPQWWSRCRNKIHFACMWSLTPMVVMDKAIEAIGGNVNEKE